MTTRDHAVTVRTALAPGDLGTVIHMHGRIYGAEQGYGLTFEAYVAESIAELAKAYDPALDRVWLCEDAGRIVGSLFLVHRENDAAQLRYFLLEPGYRGQGLGRRLMDGYMAALVELGCRTSYLWTARGLEAAAALYRRCGFRLTEEKPGTVFGRPVVEQRYDLRL
jgi:GNAT superfamily N-acetyltransferase